MIHHIKASERGVLNTVGIDQIYYLLDLITPSRIWSPTNTKIISYPLSFFYIVLADKMNVNAPGPTISRVTGLSVHYQNYQFVRSRWNGNCRTTVRHELLVITMF